jgi:hypothetical protein
VKTQRGGYFYLNVAVGEDLKRRLVERAQAEGLSLGNLVLRELSAAYGVKAEFGQNRVPKRAAGDQLFLLVPPTLDWKMAIEARHGRSSKSAVARRILSASVNGGGS